jgi:flagellar hook-length control protein FliK
VRSAGETQARATVAKPAVQPAPPSKNDADLEPILRFVKSNLSKDKASADLRIDPPELGRIRVHLDVRQDAVALRVEAASEVAQHMLERHADRLRHGLEQAGLRVTELEFRTQPEHGTANVGGNAADLAAQGDADTAATGDGAPESRSGGQDGASAEREAVVEQVMQVPTRRLETLVDVLG